VYEIDVPVRGLQLLVTNPTSAMISVDQSVQFNLSIVDGPRTISYTMTYGDAGGTTTPNDTTMYNHTFSMPGEFTVTAAGDDPVKTVSNS
jgi:PKD domain